MTDNLGGPCVVWTPLVTQWINGKGKKLLALPISWPEGSKPKNLYLYKYENVCLSVCLSVCSHLESDWDTLWHKCAFRSRNGSYTKIYLIEGFIN